MLQTGGVNWHWGTLDEAVRPGYQPRYTVHQQLTQQADARH